MAREKAVKEETRAAFLKNEKGQYLAFINDEEEQKEEEDDDVDVGPASLVKGNSSAVPALSVVRLEEESASLPSAEFPLHEMHHPTELEDQREDHDEGRLRSNLQVPSFVRKEHN